MHRARYFWLVLGLLICVSLAALFRGSVFARSVPGDQQARARPALAPSPRKPANPPADQARAIHSDTSPPLRDLAPLPVPRPPPLEVRTGSPPRGVPSPASSPAPDPIVQRAFRPGGAPGAPALPRPAPGWEGINAEDSGCRCLPPDTAGAVGPTQYVQAVNGAMQVWHKDGTSALGPVSLATLWSGFTEPCLTHLGLRPGLLYDPQANRWLIAQIANDAPATACIAVSTTSDATGTWYRYAFPLAADPQSPSLHYNPQWGRWSDGFYLSTLVADPTTGYRGPAPFVFERAAMLTGDPAARVQRFGPQGPTLGILLPASLDGATAPPAGTAAYFATLGDQIELYRLHADWTTPTQASFGSLTILPTAPYTELCRGNRDCIPQPDAPNTSLDGLGDRLGSRVGYRNLGSHDALVVTHPVDVSAGQGQAGVRWYQIDNPGGTPTIQQGSYAPDGDSRWVAAAALDRDGNLALGYSVSGPATFPSLRYTGRRASAPAGWLDLGEGTFQAGGGSQTGPSTLWGRSSSMTVDPADDCTFWFSGEFYADTAGDWRTYISSFKFPSCTAGPPPPATAPPTGGAPAPSPTPDWTQPRSFSETGHTIQGRFRQYWEEHGGLAQQGYPLTDEFSEVSALDGQTYRVQYFERAVFEWHPENPPPHDVLLAQLGTYRYRELYPQGTSGQQPNPNNPLIFAETRFTVGGSFRSYWEAHGGLAQFGFPLSDEFVEESELDGQPYTVQYFERAVFEWHPENAPPYDILLSQLGTYRLRQVYPEGPPAP
jgi:hypothetical protein